MMTPVHGEAVGIERFHPYDGRHRFAHAWLEAGGQEHDLMALCGWTSTKMIERYARATRLIVPSPLTSG